MEKGVEKAEISSGFYDECIYNYRLKAAFAKKLNLVLKHFGREAVADSVLATAIFYDDDSVWMVKESTSLFNTSMIEICNSDGPRFSASADFPLKSMIRIKKSDGSPVTQNKLPPPVIE